MRNCASGNLEIPGSMLRIVPERRGPDQPPRIGGISPDMDLRLSKALGTSQGFWYRMQAHWDMAQARL